MSKTIWEVKREGSSYIFSFHDEELNGFGYWNKNQQEGILPKVVLNLLDNRASNSTPFAKE